jgi:trigger factor
MQIKETSVEGLKHEIKVVIGGAEIERNLVDRLNEIGRTVTLPGFRPGKVPLPILRKRFAPSLLREILEKMLNESTAQAIEAHQVRPALAPQLELPSYAEGQDFEYKVVFEALPDVPVVNCRELAFERLRAEVPDDRVEAGIQILAQQRRRGEPVDRPAQSGDVILIDFVGSVDGKDFPGGSAKDFMVQLGANAVVPGLEDRLVGAKAGDHVTAPVTFPSNHPNSELAGKAAVFEVDVKQVMALQEVAIDDEFAKSLGAASIDGLKKMVREQMEHEFGKVARAKLKQQLLDHLAENLDFPVPKGMVDLEFEMIWKQLQDERARDTEAAVEYAGRDEEDIRAEFQRIADRRVRLGLILSKAGDTNNITVTEAELNRAVGDEARRNPAVSDQVIAFFQNNKDAVARLQAGIFEEKVVDFILEMARISERLVSVEELLRDESEAAANPAIVM